MTLKQFDDAMQRANSMRMEGEKLIARAKQIEEEAVCNAGVCYVSREAGFPCWTAGGGHYYGTAREAVKALEKSP